MSTEEIQEFVLDGEEIEVVDSYNLLGSIITSTAKCTKEIRRRIAMAKVSFKEKDKIFRSRDLTLRTKIRLVQSMIFPIVSYGCEGWTMTAKDKKYIDSFELWCWRRILRVPWTARRSNQSIIEEI